MGDSPGANVLRSIGLNLGPEQGGEVDDLALAKAMQEQERAYYLLTNQHAVAAWDMSPNSENEAPAQPSDSNAAILQQQQPPTSAPDTSQPSSAAAVAAEPPSRQGAGGASSSAAEAAEAEALSDAEFALRLQQEEHHSHMMALAGYGPDGEVSGEEFSDDEEEGFISDDSVDPDEMTYEELQALGDAVGTVSRGLPASAVAALPVRPYQPSAAGEEEQCAVCREEYEAEEEVVSLPCSHFYHPACITQWLAHQKVCPICSQEVSVTPDKGKAAGA